MKAYIATTGVIFGLITVAHVLRVIQEGGQLAREPWFVALTVVAACLSVWAWRLLCGSARLNVRIGLAVMLAVALAALTLACAAPRAEFHASPDAALRALPFSEAVRAGDYLFVSGQIGVVPGSLTLAPGGIGPEARQALDNLRDVLERHGASLAQVVKCTVFLADMGEWPAFNSVYREVFHEPFPARSALGANGLALGARVEVECIAFAPAGSE